MSEQKPDRMAYAMLFVAPVLMTSNMLAARWVEGSIPPVSLTFWRWTLTLLILAPFAGPRLWRFRAEARREWKTTLALGALGMGVCGAPVYIGGITTSATNIGLIYAATPVLIVVFARLFWGEPVVPVKALGTALCLAGVVAIVTKGDIGALLQLEFTEGDLWIVLAMLGWALYSVLLRYRPSRLPLMARFTAIVLAGVLVNLPFYAFEAALGYETVLDLRTAAVILFVALVPGLAAFVLYGRLVALLGAQRTGLLMYLVPLYNAGLAYLLLGETLRPFHLAGVALILPGLWLATQSGRPAVAKAAAGSSAR
jgi:drug/metabolite transporter (DMT)-like permease